MLTPPIRVLINGAFGKMGRLSTEALKQHPGFEVVAQCGRHDALAEQLTRHKPDVALDLTHAEVALEHLTTIIAHGVRPVIGTSGLNQSLLAPLQQQCQQIGLGGIIAPNFSIAAVLMMRFASQAVAYFQSAEIIEAHHPAKRDAPSGTAIKTAELLAQHGAVAQTHNVAARGDHTHGVPIHSLRIEGVLAKQQVWLGNSGESLLIEANANDRQAFMPGVLLSCHKVMSLNRLVYGLEGILN
jgi:4-hydroxy-tetrahydrodipicolinate reductase